MKTPSCVQVFNRLKNSGLSPRTFYDVGASTGCWSVSLSSVFPQAEYHLFEPLAQANEEYRQALTTELGHRNNFFLHCMALGETMGMATVSVSPEAQGSTVLDVPASSYFPKKISAPLQTIDDLVGNRIIPAPDILKLDVQGSENKILRGAVRTLSRVQALQIECWIYPGYGEDTALMSEIISFLQGQGFVAIEFSDPYYDKNHQLHTLDLYFLKLDLATRWSAQWSADSWCF